jgi:hypothetical protein
MFEVCLGTILTPLSHFGRVVFQKPHRNLMSIDKKHGVLGPGGLCAKHMFLARSFDFDMFKNWGHFLTLLN